MNMNHKGFLLFVVVLIFSCFSFIFSIAAEEKDPSLDSFTVTEEYRKIVSSLDLIERLKQRDSFYDESIEYAVMYDNIIAEFHANGRFERRMKSGKINFEDVDSWNCPTLYVPIVDAKTSQTVTYAECWNNGQHTYHVAWIDLQGEIITRKSLNDKFGVTSSYVLLNFDRSCFIYCWDSNGLYRYTSLLSIRDEGKCYTVEEASEYLDYEMRQSSKMFWGNLLPGLLYHFLIYVILPLCGVFLILFLIRFAVYLCKHKKKNARK